MSAAYNERYRVPALEIDGWEEGDLGYLHVISGRAVLTRIAIPSDWATVSYVLGISGGIPTWLPAGADTVLDGFGNGFGNNFGGPP